MAAALESHVRAAQKFLTSVRHLPSFKEARNKQVELVAKKLAANPLSVEQAASLVALLDDGIWEEHLDGLKGLFCLTEGGGKKNAPLQDYLAMPHYLTAAMWKVLSEDQRSVALEKLCRHLRALGLKNPSEVTQGMVLCLVFDLEGNLLGTQQWAVTLREKANVQKYLKQASHGPFLINLPHDRSECSSEVMQRVFGDEEPMDCIVPYEDLLARAKDWPMRNTHRFAQGKQQHLGPVLPSGEGGDLMNQMGHFVAGLMRGQSHSDASLPGLKFFSKERKEERNVSAPALALEDKKAEVSLEPAAESTVNIDRKPSGEDAVAKTLQALQCELQDKPAVEASGKTGKGKAKNKVKKPTAKKSQATKKKPAAALRRPAASAASARGTARAGESREARRLRLINVFVPKHIQAEYRDGCSKYYYRKGCTLSCWKLRGFEMSD